MNKLGNYLKEHLSGELIESTDVLDYFSRDLSPLSIKPSMVAFPRDEKDVRKITRFCYQLSERGRYLPITPRGFGSSDNGSSLGSGLILSMSSHLNKINYIDQKNLTVNVQAGIGFNSLQESMSLLGMEIPFTPQNSKNLTLGGVISSNLSGASSHKYGGIEKCILSMKVILSNGEIIEVKEISNKELNHKIGQTNFEGEIYRGVDNVYEDLNISDFKRDVARDSSMYNLPESKKAQSLNLIPLFIGSEGTLGIISEVTLKLKAIDDEYSRKILIGIENNIDTSDVISILNSSEDKPDEIEYIDSSFFRLVSKFNPNHFDKWIKKPYSKGYLLVKYKGNQKTVNKSVQKMLKNLRNISLNILEIDDTEEINLEDRIKSALVEISNFQDHKVSSYPIVDINSPKNCISELLNGIDIVIKKSSINLAYYGNLAEGNIKIMGLMDPGEVADRQAFFKVIKDGSDLAISLGGSMAANGGVGRLKTPYLNKQYTDSGLQVFKTIKKIFDPMNILSPDIKFNTSEDHIKKALVNNKYLRFVENI